MWECVFPLSLSLRTSSPIRLLRSVMGAQGGLRPAPWSVLIWLAFRYGPDTLPLTRKETQTTPPPPAILSTIPLFLSPLCFLFSLPLSHFVWQKQTHTHIEAHTHIFFPCLHLSFHTTTTGRGKMRTNWYESQGKKPGGKKKREKGSSTRLQGNCKHKSTDILLWCSLCKCIYSSLWCP